MYLSVSYDITRTKARNKIVKLLESYGFRVQKSVFEIELNESQFEKLKFQLWKILDVAQIYYKEVKLENNDSVKFYILSKVWEWNLEWRVDGLWKWYEKIYFPDILIL